MRESGVGMDLLSKVLQTTEGKGSWSFDRRLIALEKHDSIYLNQPNFIIYVWFLYKVPQTL